MMGNDLRIPDIEVIVSAAGSDVAVFCYYTGDDIHSGYEVVCGIPTQGAREAIRAILQDAIEVLNAKDWFTVDELRTQIEEETDEPPF